MSTDMAGGGQVVTRFAPSPTGYLHVGGARTALFSWLLARRHGRSGRFLLRIEDTDLARSTEQASAQLIEDLRWLGLHWDNPQLVYQSKRTAVYNRLIGQLLASGRAYRAYETTEELDGMRKQAEREKRSFVYRRRSDIAPEQIRQWEAASRPHVVRFAMPVREWRFTDEILGQIVFPAAEVQDFVIRKADGMPTFHFAVVVDDAEMGVTHVLRGQEHVKNTFYHVALQEALGYRRPAYAHLTTIQNPDGSKMGKRDRDKAIRQRVQQWIKAGRGTIEALAGASGVAAGQLATWLADSRQQLDLPQQSAVMAQIGMAAEELPEILIHDFRRSGYLPEALLNFLALLGWSPGGDRERMSTDEMIGLFSLDRVGKSNPKFDRAKLMAFNTQICSDAATGRLVAAMRDYLSVNPASPLNKATDEQLASLIDIKRGFRILRELEQMSRFFFVEDDRIAYDRAAMEKVLLASESQGLTVLRELRPALADLDWTKPTLESAVKTYCDAHGLGLAKAAQPLRVAISGTTISPPIFESLEILGRARTLARIDRCIAQATAAA